LKENHFFWKSPSHSSFFERGRTPFLFKRKGWGWIFIVSSRDFSQKKYYPYGMRRKTHIVQIGNVCVGGDNPIVVQSMTSTDTGSEIVRITVDRPESAEAVPNIYDIVRKESEVPIVGDFHFNGHVLLSKYPDTAKLLEKYRINPGNVGRGEKRDRNFEAILEIAIQHNKPIRIGVNGGSLDPELLQQKMDRNKTSGSLQTDQEIFEEAMVESAITSAEFAVEFGVPKEKIVLSAKVSEPQSLIRIHESLAEKCHFPIHLGLTEAGGGLSGIVWSTAALSILLQKGIGDTIRVSITPGSGESRTKEVLVAREILQSLGIRNFSPKITSCPGCGRTTGNDFQTFTENLKKQIEKKLPLWREKYPRSETLKIAVMGCIVNGPGEACHADIGIFFPGKGEGKLATVYIDGEHHAELSGEKIDERFLEILEMHLEKR
jgi:(E)-4-hydroxy-3-methylbut-2-enyl-diphosphate synthase